MTKTSGAPRVGFRWAAACVLAAAVAAGAAPASAQPKGGGAAQSAKKPAAPSEVTGTVLDIDKEEIVLDVGSDAGVTENMTVDLWRPLKLKHPVTGKIVSDRFKIGQIQIGQVRPAMSLAKASGALSRPAAAGDLILFPRSAAATTASTTTGVATSAATTTTASPTTTAPSHEEETAPEDVDAKNVADMFEGLKNQNIQARVARYEEFLRAHPESRFFTVIFEENIALKRLLQPVDTAPSARPTSNPTPYLISSPTATDAIPGKPFHLSAEIGNADGAVLQLRRKGETLFVPIPMKHTGDRYFSAIVPAERIDGRTLEYFIEATSANGTYAMVGTAREPHRVDVTPNPKNSPPLSGQGSVTLLTDYADYNRMRGNDWASQTEATFGIRFKDLGIRAVRMGFGVYRGVGGSVKELDDEKLQGRLVGLTYGYVEAEIGIHRLFSIIGRTSVGLLDNGVGGGGQLFARIGNDRGTNLAIGGEILGGVGLRSIIELQLNTFERFPILLRTEVSNQPAGSAPSASEVVHGTATQTSDPAGRGVVQLGFRVTPDFTIAVRGSFQGRNINHAGPGFGGSVGYTW